MQGRKRHSPAARQPTEALPIAPPQRLARQFGPPQAVRPAFHGQTPPQSRIAAAIGGAAAAAPLSAQAGLTTLAGLASGPPIIAILASALQSGHAAWQIGQRRLADLAGYVRLRRLRRGG